MGGASVRLRFTLLARVLGMLVLVLSTVSYGQLELNEIVSDPVGLNTALQTVELRNAGASAYNTGPAPPWLFFSPARYQLPDNVSIPSGGTVLVHINSPGTSTSTDFYTGSSGMRDLEARGPDAVGLFATNLFTDPNEILSFVQWGGAGNVGETVAIAGGVWSGQVFVNVDSLREGSSIAYDGGGIGPSDWCIDGTPSPGGPNDACTAAFAKSPVIINEICRVASQSAMEFYNAGNVTEDLGGKWAVLNNEHSYQFPTGTTDTLINPGDFLILHLGADGTDGALNFYTGSGTFRNFLSTDSVSFHALTPFTDSTTVIDFVQWGAAGSPLEAAAVAAQVWVNGEFVDNSQQTAQGSLASFGATVGADRWSVDNTPTPSVENSTPPAATVVINEALVDPSGADPQNTRVELHNTLGSSVDVSGFTLCASSQASPGTPLCFSIPPGTNIPGNGFLTINLNAVGSDGGGEVYTGAFQDLNASGDSLLLFFTNDPVNPYNLMDYVRWGTGSFGEELADQAGIWSLGESVDVSLVADGSSIAYKGEGNGPNDYRIDVTPSIGADNAEPESDLPFRRADCNDDGLVDLSDAINLLSFLFSGGNEPFCKDACDANDDETLDISDPIYSLNYLFEGGPDPPSPGPTQCGMDPADPADFLHCGSYLNCP